MSALADQETFELRTLSRQLTPNCTKTSSVHVDYSHIENQRSFVLIQNPQIYSDLYMAIELPLLYVFEDILNL